MSFFASVADTWLPDSSCPTEFGHAVLTFIVIDYSRQEVVPAKGKIPGPAKTYFQFLGVDLSQALSFTFP